MVFRRTALILASNNRLRLIIHFFLFALLVMLASLLFSLAGLFFNQSSTLGCLNTLLSISSVRIHHREVCCVRTCLHVQVQLVGVFFEGPAQLQLYLE